MRALKLRSAAYGLGGLMLIAVLVIGTWVWLGGISRIAFLSIETTGTNPGFSQSEAAGRTRQNELGRPVPVEVVEARKSKTTNDMHAIGSLQSDESVVLAPELSGRVSEVAFEEGRPVKKGDILLKLDDALAQAEVADAKARLTLAAANNERARALVKTGSVTERGRDEAIANYETAQAALALAATKLAKLVLRAPFDGVAGLRGISSGAFVNAGTPIANLEKIDALKVEFKLPEIHLQAVNVGQKIELRVDAIPGRVFDGTIYAINPLVDVNGRALQIRARLDNPDFVLRPGLFARVVIKGLSERDVILVPEAAVMPKGEEAFVFLIKDGKAIEKRVKLGQRSNAEVEILEGIVAPAAVVTAGQQKLRDGAPIEIVPSDANQSQSRAIERDQSAAPGRRG